MTDHRSFLASVPQARRVELTRRSDWPGIKHALAHFGLIALVGGCIAVSVPGWPLLLPIQGVLIVFLFTLSHEATHQTPFAIRLLNEGAGHLVGVLLILPFHWFRAFHLAHHRWTNLPGQDPELEVAKPRTRAAWVWHVTGLPLWWASVMLVIRLALGREKPAYLGTRAKQKAEREARVLLIIYVAVAVFSIWNPVLLWIWIVPVLLGQPALRLYLLAEHGDCPQVADMFANTRTVFTTRIIRFLAWNMPYHTEHHVWPQVPFHQLPALHTDMKAHLKVTSDGYTAFTQGYLARLQGGGQADRPDPS